MRNIHITPVPAIVIADTLTNIDACSTALAPYMIPLTPEERHNLLKMGNKTLSFVVKALDYARHYPQLCPSFLNIVDFEADVADATGLRTLHIAAKQLADNIDDTIMVAGSEAYQSALVFYNAIKIAAAQDIPGAKEIYHELKARFPGGRRRVE